MADHVIHISEEEAASDFTSVLARVRAGAEVVTESGGDRLPLAVMHPPVPLRRTISKCIALAKRHEEESGELSQSSTPTLLPMLRRLSATANPGIRRRGTDPRFKHCCRR